MDLTAKSRAPCPCARTIPPPFAAPQVPSYVNRTPLYAEVRWAVGVETR